MNWDKLKAYMQNPDIALENIKRVVPSEDELLILDREMADKLSSGQASPEDIKAMTSAREMGMTGAGMAGSLGKVGKSLGNAAETLVEKGVTIGGNRFRTLKEALDSGIPESVYTNAKQASYRPTPDTNFGKVIDLTKPKGKLDTSDLVKEVRSESKQIGKDLYPTLKDANEASIPPSSYSKAKQQTYKNLEVPSDYSVPEPKFTNLQKLIQKEKEMEFGTRPEIVSNVSKKIDEINTEDAIRQLSKNRREAIKSTESLEDLTQLINIDRRGANGK